MGFLLLLLSGVFQGSFGLGYKKYNPLSWEAFWGIYSMFCLIITVAWTFITEHNALSIILNNGISAFIPPFICGILWGLSTIAFSKAVLILGMSLCFGVNMGVSAVVGTIVPFITSDKTPTPYSISLLLLGIVITLIGIYTITKAGLLKEKTKHTKNTKLGIIFAVISGLCSGIMNIGFDIASPLGKLCSNDIASAAIQWFPVLTGGMIASILFCIFLISKNKTWNTYTKDGAISRFAKLFITSIIWFFALILYGISSKLIGSYGSSIGWLIFNAIALIVSNLWGIFMGEWTNCKKAVKLLVIGDIILVISWIIIMGV